MLLFFPFFQRSLQAELDRVGFGRNNYTSAKKGDAESAAPRPTVEEHRPSLDCPPSGLLTSAASATAVAVLPPLKIYTNDLPLQSPTGIRSLSPANTVSVPTTSGRRRKAKNDYITQTPYLQSHFDEMPSIDRNMFAAGANDRLETPRICSKSARVEAKSPKAPLRDDLLEGYTIHGVKKARPKTDTFVRRAGYSSRCDREVAVGGALDRAHDVPFDDNDNACDSGFLGAEGKGAGIVKFGDDDKGCDLDFVAKGADVVPFGGIDNGYDFGYLGEEGKVAGVDLTGADLVELAGLLMSPSPVQEERENETSDSL